MHRAILASYTVYTAWIHCSAQCAAERAKRVIPKRGDLGAMAIGSVSWDYKPKGLHSVWYLPSAYSRKHSEFQRNTLCAQFRITTTSSSGFSVG